MGRCHGVLRRKVKHRTNLAIAVGIVTEGYYSITRNDNNVSYNNINDDDINIIYC